MLGVGLLGLLLSRLDRVALLQILGRERVSYFIAAVAIYISGQVVASVRWRYLAAMLAVRGRLGEFVAYFFVGVFTNLFVPGLVGGDAARALYLGRRHGALGRAAASVLADRAVGLLALVWFAAACAFSLGPQILPRAMLAPMLAAGVIAMLACPLMPAAIPLIRRMPAWLAKPAAMLTPYLGRPLDLLPAVGLSLVLHFSQVLCQYLLSVGLGFEIPFWFFLLCVPTTNFFAAMPVTLNGLGIREGSYVLLFSLIGLPKADAVALGLLWFATATLSGLVGGLAFIVARASPEMAPETTATIAPPAAARPFGPGRGLDVENRA